MEGYIFMAVCVCVSVCACVCVCVSVCLCLSVSKMPIVPLTYFEVVFVERLFSILTQIILKLVTLCRKSRSNVQNLAKNLTMGHISNAVSSIDFILGTKVQPN